MGTRHQSGQALIELTLLCCIFATLLIGLEAMMNTRRKSSNKYKVSKEITTEKNYEKPHQK